MSTVLTKDNNWLIGYRICKDLKLHIWLYCWCHSICWNFVLLTSPYNISCFMSLIKLQSNCQQKEMVDIFRKPANTFTTEDVLQLTWNRKYYKLVNSKLRALHFDTYVVLATYTWSALALTLYILCWCHQVHNTQRVSLLLYMATHLQWLWIGEWMLIFKAYRLYQLHDVCK